MATKYILDQAGKKLGLNPQDSGPDKLSGDRSVLLRYLNEACRELYDQADMVGVDMEQVFKINGDQTITCPWYVGPIRGARELASQQVWHINQMRPRYNQFNWKDMWRNLRVRNTQALQYTLKNQSIVQVTVPKIEDVPVEVTIVGPTDLASSYVENILMDEDSIQLPDNSGFYKESVGNYNDILYVAKSSINAYDISLTDTDGNPLTVIPNCMLEASYQIIDVSACPWLSQNTSPQSNYLEILYKKGLQIMFNDEDSFPSRTNYDDILVNKIMQLAKEEEDKPELAMAYDQKATRSLARKIEDQNRATEDRVALTSNEHDNLILRIRSGRRRRWAYYGRGNYL